MLASMATLQVRDIPEDTRRVLKQRAAAAGMSLSDYVRAELTRLAAQPTIEELTARIRLRGATEPDAPAADVLAAERAE